ncbi:hypothetical protein [Buttiauxella sp.]|uniref:hypothetical protein n=1 Tax=Buttiauxella sp. TaxID=1972222 RepID=UPI003C790A18
MQRYNWLMDADSFMRPAYRISPFNTHSISKNSQHTGGNTINGWLDKRFSGYYRRWTLKGRDAIFQALENLSLSSDDTVTVLSTTNNFYISSCVTGAIEKMCRWDREISVKTKAILVVHEFGSLYPDMTALYQMDVPVIEDFAHAFCAVPANDIQADYLILSFPKFFPVQYGGMLLSKQQLTSPDPLPVENRHYLCGVLSDYIDELETIQAKRVANHQYLKEAFEEFGCQPRFDWLVGEIPSVFMFSVPDFIDLQALKVFMQNAGIESSIFYGERAFFIPLHQGLTRVDLDYFICIYQAFHQQQSEQQDAH